MTKDRKRTQLQRCADEHAKTHKPGTITDIFNELHYLLLLGERVVVGDRTYPHNFFSDNRDIALGASAGVLWVYCHML
jgi:hypothetical protein